MKKSKKRLLSTYIWGGILIFCLMSSMTFAQIVRNGGFESSDTGIVKDVDVRGWLIQVVETINLPAVFEIVDNPVKQGNRALKISVHGLGTNQWDIQTVADSLPVKQGTTYSYSIWAKAEKAGAQVNFTVGRYSYAEYSAIRPATLTTEWKEFKMQFTVSDEQTFIRAPIHFNYAANANNVIYVDNLKIADVNAGKKPVIVEAESGTIGSEFLTQQEGDITYITTSKNYTGLTSPGDASRVITYQVTFQDSGYYNLFARVRVGAGGYDDDSFFYGRGFGVKSDTASADWVFINGLAGAGFSNATDFVDGPGTLGSQVWKWVNITKNFYQGAALGASFFVNIDSLSKTFQIASREDGLYIDKIAFGKTSIYFTVEALDKELPGSATKTEPDSSKYFKGPPLASGAAKFLGSAYSDVQDEIFANYWTPVTPENASKWANVAGSQDTTRWNWTGFDRAYKCAIDNKLIFKGHTLIWGQQQPSWISGLDSALPMKYITTWFRKIGERYPKMDMMDVVNEPLAGHNPPDGANGRANYKKALGGNGETGWDWVINSFKLARKYLPNAKLLLNDYGIINDNTATTNYLKIINLLLERKLIDGIGVQGHRFEFESANVNTLKSNLDRLAATGLPIYISEMDLGNLNNAGTPNDTQQLQLYQKIFPVIGEHPGVKGITLWGYLEGRMWQTTCHLVLSDGTWRPAMKWLAQYLKDYIANVEPTKNALPVRFNLEQNYPNPFNPITNIRFSITETTKISLKIYDVLGREVVTLVNELLNAGVYDVTWDAKSSDGSKVVSGPYFYRLVAGDHVISQKMLLLK